MFPSLLSRHSSAVVPIHGRPVTVTWSPSAARELGRRAQPLFLELELYFSCLVKKFVHFHDAAPGLDTVRVTDRLHLAFHAVTSTACTMDLAERLGRQPEVELDTPAVRRLAPRQVSLDFAGGQWRAAFSM